MLYGIRRNGLRHGGANGLRSVHAPSNSRNSPEPKDYSTIGLPMLATRPGTVRATPCRPTRDADRGARILPSSCQSVPRAVGVCGYTSSSTLTALLAGTGALEDCAPLALAMRVGRP